MKNILKNQLVLLFVMSGFTIPSLAQDSTHITIIESVKPFTGIKGFRTWSVGINGGILTPTIAIGGSNDFTKWKPSFGYGLYVKNQFTHSIGIQAEFLKGTLEGNNDNDLGNGTRPQSPYSSFKTDLNWSASLSAVVTLANINWLQQRSMVLPYISVGAGWVDYNPTLMITSSNTKLDYKPDGSIKELFIPLGAGVKFNISTGVNIDLGYRINFVDGDNLDGYQRGPDKDKFSYGYAGVEFALGDKTKPQLTFNNPAAQLKRDLQDENNALKVSVDSSIAANKESMQENLTQINALKDELDKFKKDSDNDGVSDYFDKCPGTPAGEKVDGTGCALPKPPAQEKIVITEEDRRIVNEAIKNLEFDLGKAILRESSFPSLDKVADILVKKNFSLKLAGHTDNVGSETANMKLSKNRAESVKAYLVSKGVNPSRVEATGYGETQPIASNKTAAGRQQNRRVEFTLY